MNTIGNEKIRILSVITQSEVGGAQQFLAQMIGNIDPDRFECTVVAGQDGRDQLRSTLPENIRYIIAKTLRRDPHVIDDIRSLFELRRIFKQIRPDIIFLNSSKAGFNGSWAASMLPTRLAGVRVIYRIGGWTFNDPHPRWKQWGYRMLEKVSARWKDVIVVNNMHDLEQAKRLGIRPRQQLLCIPNGIEPYLETLPKEQARAALTDRIPANRRDAPYDWLVGTIANFYPAKDLVSLIRAASRVSPNVRFIVIGGGQLRADLEREIAQHDLQNRFFLIGSMDQAYRYLSAFDVFALPSVKEGFPWAVLEAMAAKVPVVATRVGAIPEILQDHISGLLIQPREPEQLARAIIELLEHDKLRQDLAIQAHQQLIAHYTLREMISKYEQLFS